MNKTTTSSDAQLADEKICTICNRKGHYAKEHEICFPFEEQFPSLKGFAILSEKGEILIPLKVFEKNCLDKEVVRKAIDKVMPCSSYIDKKLGERCNDPECIWCNDSKKLKKELGL